MLSFFSNDILFFFVCIFLHISGDHNSPNQLLSDVVVAIANHKFDVVVEIPYDPNQLSNPHDTLKQRYTSIATVMEKRYEEFSHRLDGIDATLNELKEGMKLLLKSSQMNTDADGYKRGLVNNRTHEDDHKPGNIVDTRHGSDHHPIPTENSNNVLKVPAKGKTKCNFEYEKFRLKNTLERMKNSRCEVDIFSIIDVLLYDAQERPIASLELENVMERYESFKKFDRVADHSGHFFASQKSPLEQKLKDWDFARIKKEWKDVEKNLPENMYVRAYKRRMDLLRVVIIGPKGTPYHDGLFCFDVCFQSTHPYQPPNAQNQMTDDDYVPEDEYIWVPATSNMLQLLVYLQSLFNAKPLRNNVVYKNPIFKEVFVVFFNEITYIRSVKTMESMMNRPPRNFEDFVVGHFRSRAHDILKAHKAYTEGVQVGCLVNGVPKEDHKGTVSDSFKDDLVECSDSLVAAFKRIGVELS